MTNINTFFENTNISNMANLLTNKQKEEIENDNICTFSDVDDNNDNENFKNLLDIKKTKSDNSNNNKKNLTKISQQNIETNKKTNFENLNINLKNIPKISKEFAYPKNLNSKIDNLFQDFKGSSLFGSVVPFQNNNIKDFQTGGISCQAQAEKSKEKEGSNNKFSKKININNINNINNLSTNFSNLSTNNNNINNLNNLNSLNNNDKNFSKKEKKEFLTNNTTRRNRNLNNNNNLNVNESHNNIGNINNLARELSNSSTREEFGFERNKKRALNSTKEICSLISKPNAEKINLKDLKEKERLSSNKEMKNYSNLNNLNNLNSNKNNTNSNKNSRYHHLMNKSNTSFIDNNASININNNSILNKNMKCPNPTLNNQEKIRDALNSQNNTNYSFVTSSIDPNTNTNFGLNRKNFNTNNLNNLNNLNMNTTNGLNFNFENDHVNLKTPDLPFTTVKDVGYKEEMNPKFKNNMEDFVKVINNFNNTNMDFFGLFDGHGGDDPVKYCKENISKTLEKIINEKNDSIEDCLKKAYLNIDEKLKFYDSENSGCTSTIVLIVGKILYIANVGDSACFIVNKNKEFRKISVDHTCLNEKELERIKNLNGKVINNRVCGQLALTRALGDHSLRKYGVIPEPHTNQIQLNASDKFVLIASDGIWDVLKEEDLNILLNNNEKCEKICENLIQEAMKKGSKDNISCILVRLN